MIEEDEDTLKWKALEHEKLKKSYAHKIISHDPTMIKDVLIAIGDLQQWLFDEAAKFGFMNELL